jgi:hypothetical protein
MKGKIAALLAGIVLGSAGIGGAAASHLLYVRHAGVACGFGTGPQGRGVACTRPGPDGYAVTLTKTRAIVWKGTHRIFFRKLP